MIISCWKSCKDYVQVEAGQGRQDPRFCPSLSPWPIVISWDIGIFSVLISIIMLPALFNKLGYSWKYAATITPVTAHRKNIFSWRGGFLQWNSIGMLPHCTWPKFSVRAHSSHRFLQNRKLPGQPGKQKHILTGTLGGYAWQGLRSIPYQATHSHHTLLRTREDYRKQETKHPPSKDKTRY